MIRNRYNRIPHPAQDTERLFWAASWQNQRNDCAPSEDSDQPGHPPSLIRVFAVRMKKAWVLCYPLSAQRRLWSDWADAQADLSLRWAHTYFVSFLMSRLFYACSHEDNRITFRGCHFDVMSRLMTKPTKCPVRPAKTDQPGHPPSRISLRCPHEET